MNAIVLNKPSNIENARRGWGDALPDWVEALATEADRLSGVDVAKRLSYSAAVISGVINGNYKGSLAAVEQKVRGAFMGAMVICPVLDEIGRDRCLDEQKKKFSGTSAIRTRLYNACRRGCEHSRLTKIEEASNA